MTKPVILTIDDEPDVLNAIERDLRQHFQNEYRIIKASSAQEGIEVSHSLKKRGTPLALFLVDERMPEMSGTEFLNKVLKLFPESCKVLLTAYADTEAAIRGINEVELDHYLLKPWDPPEQHLYPILDDLLIDWAARFRPPYDGIRVAGSRWSPQSYAIKDFLSRTQTPYEWVDLDSDEPTRELVESLTSGLKKQPVVFFPDGVHLLAPTKRELALHLGRHIEASEPFYDIIIVGGGPSGLAAAVYGSSEGLRTILIEEDATGGQAGTSSQIENYLGFPSGIAGADLARRATTQARRFGAEVISPRTVQTIRVEHPYRIVILDDGTELQCYAILLATGMQVRHLEIPGVKSFTGAGIYYGAGVSEAASYRNAAVTIIGGANSAGQGALLFARYARKVTMLIRGESLFTSMSSYLADRIEETDNIEVLTHTTVTEVHGDNHLEEIKIKRNNSDEHSTVTANAMFIFIGSKPQSDMVADLVKRDDYGFIITGSDLHRNGKQFKGWTLNRDPLMLETSVPGIFASGDVRCGSTKRVASAVGEGSAAIGIVHEYLKTV